MSIVWTIFFWVYFREGLLSRGRAAFFWDKIRVRKRGGGGGFFFGKKWVKKKGGGGLIIKAYISATVTIS